MRLGFGLLGAVLMMGAHAAMAQSNWSPDAYEPRRVERPRPSAPPPRPADRRPVEHPAQGYWEGHWEGRWVPMAPPPPAPVYAPYSRAYAPEPVYVEDYPPAPPPRRYRQDRPGYGDGWSNITNSASANVVVQNAPMTMTTTETITEYSVEEAPRVVRRAAPAKRRVAKKPQCVCHIVYR